MPTPKSSKGSSRPGREERSSRGDKAPRRLNGWAAVAKKREEYDEEKERREQEKDRPRDFWLKSGETAIVQFLSDEPYTFDSHSIKDKRGNFRTIPCQLNSQKHCLVCRDGIKQGFKSAFLVLDYRGNWDKEKKRFKNDEPIEKLWVMNMTQIGVLQARLSKSKKSLTELVLEVERTGSGKNDTAYTFVEARDDDDQRLKPKKWKTENDLKELCAPPTDEELEDMGFEKPDED